MTAVEQALGGLLLINDIDADDTHGRENRAHSLPHGHLPGVFFTEVTAHADQCEKRKSSGFDQR